MENSGTSFFAMNIVLLFAFVSFILIVFGLHGLAFVFELLLLLVSLFILVFSMFIVYHSMRWGWTFLGAALIFLLLDSVFISLLAKTFDTAHITSIVFFAAGLVIALLNFRGDAQNTESITENQYGKDEEYYSLEDYSPSKDYYLPIFKIEAK